MNRYKRLIVFVVSVMMVCTTFPLSAGLSFAVEGEGNADPSSEPQASQETEETQQVTQPENQNTETSIENPTEAKDSGQQSQDGSDSTQDGRSTDLEQNETEESTAPILKAQDVELPSGAVSGASGWIWKIVGDEGDYTLTFEYTGTADTPPAFEIPSSSSSHFIDSIKGSFGDISVNDIKKIDIPEGCTKIQPYAFQNMDGITRVDIASTVRTIDNVAFGDNANDTDAPLGCGKLQEVVIHTNASGKSELAVVAARAFNGCKALKTIENLDKTNLYNIGYGGFMNTAVESFNLPDTLATNASAQIGQYAFARNNNLKSVNIPAFFYMSNTVGTYTFAYCPALEDVTFREVAGATVRNNTTNRQRLPDYIFQGASSLSELDLSAWSKSTNASSFLLYETNFRGTNLSDLNKIILPEKNISIETGTFRNKSGLTSTDQLENFDRVTSLGTYAFANCDNLVKADIPSKVTNLSDYAFANDESLKEVNVKAANLTTAGANVFKGSEKIETVTVSDATKTLTANFLCAVPKGTDVLFEGENVIQITAATVQTGQKPLNKLAGNYYVDSKGVLYKLENDGKASLAYIPPGLTSYTVPESFETPNGTEYTVTSISPNALNLADDLTALTVAKPENVYLKPSAFTGWSKSTDNMGKTINGKAFIDVDEWARVSTLCDFPLEEGSGAGVVQTVENPVQNADGEDILRTLIVVNDKAPSEDDSYDYKTGQKATYTIAISNEDNTIMDKIVRVYFAYDSDGYNLGSFPVGTKPIEDGGKKFPMEVVETNVKGVYYYDITGIDPGYTLAFQNDVFYSSPGSSGGELKIWTHTLSEEEAEEKRGEVINPKEYLKLDWDTTPQERTYTKTNTKVYNTQQTAYLNPIILTDTSGNAYVSSLAYKLTEANKGGSSENVGKDYILGTHYEDTITLPEELYWKEDILTAIKNGNYEVVNGSTYYDGSTGTKSSKVLRVTAASGTYDLAYLTTTSGLSYSYIEDFKAVVLENGKLKLSWNLYNQNRSGRSATAEFPVEVFYLRIGDGPLRADLDKVNDLMEREGTTDLKSVLKINNTANETRKYSYSPNQTAQSSVVTPIDANSNVLINKTHQNNNGSYTSRYGGQDEFFNITVNNTGILNLNQWGKPVKDSDGATQIDENGKEVYDGHLVTDSLGYLFYIEPARIEQMLKESVTLGTGANAQTAKIGDWLTVTITNGSLYTEGQYQPVDGTNQTNKYTVSSSSNISHANDNGLRVNERAKIVITTNSDGIIEATLSGDTIEENNKSYIIGTGGDYASLNAFFTAIGYMPTLNTLYKVDYELNEGENFTLKPGQRLVIPIRTSYKTTPMLLTVDTESYYGNTSISVNNTANVSLKVGTESVSRNVSPPTYHYWSRELYFSKYGYLQGQSTQLTGSSIVVEEGSVIDTVLSSYNYSGKAYQHMQWADYMNGAQVALVPVAQNPNLKAADGTDLEVYTTGGVQYYLLNKPGTYENVVIGSTSGRNATQNLKATIVVSTSSSGGKVTSLNTQFKWDPTNNWGGSSATTYIYYKVLVDAGKAGIVAADNPGETTTFTINNKAWLGDHQGHRLWDVMGVVSQVYDFEKYIITKDGKKDGTDTGDSLTDFSRIKHGESVTYQIELNNISSSPAVLSGNNIRDVLPLTYNKFAWEKGVNVTGLRYYGSDGLTITYGTGDNEKTIPADGTINSSAEGYWTISNTNASNGTYQINWDSSFRVHYPANGKLKILVELTFPERPEDGASVWDQYVAANAGNALTNIFYLNGRSERVDHLLESEGKAVLYKGVVDTGITTTMPGSSGGRCQYYSNNSRLMYSNGIGGINDVVYSSPDLKASTVTYYTVLYNGSYDRLYLSDLQDQLPKGFYFQSMCNTTSTSTWFDYDGNYTPTDASTYSSHNWRGFGRYGNTIAYDTISEGYNTSSTKLVTINNSADALDNNKVKYVNARVSTAPPKMGEDGCQHLTFTIKGNPSQANGSNGIIKYDSEVGKYYLNPGECVRFGYNVLVDQYAKTEDFATNTVTMPYYDYYNTGFTNAADLGTVQKPWAASGITNNDGTCTMMTGDDVKDQFGVDISKYQADEYKTLEKGNYMVSSVTLERAPITPGIQKSIGGLTTRITNPSTTSVEGSLNGSFGSTYSGGAKSSDVVNWRIRVYDESVGRNDDVSSMMTNYTVQDTVQSPYGFTGQVWYRMYRTGGTALTNAQYLFTLGTRTEGDTSVRISTGSAISGNTTLRIGSAENTSDDQWFTFGTGLKSGRVKIERDAEGQEIMTIEMTGSQYSVPAGCWAEFCLHTLYNEDTTVVSAIKFNDAVVYPEQDYDSSTVAQGRARTKQEYNEAGELVTKNDGIQSGTSIVLTQGYTTESWKAVTENADKSNTARSDENKNIIPLGEKTNDFKYDLYIVGPQKEMSRIVIIDDLPHEGDHSAFVEADKRFSEFKVGFVAENLDLKVALAPSKGGKERVLSEDEYEAFVSTKTEFKDADWKGNGDGWTKLNGLSDAEKAQVLKDAMSIRVVIKDSNAWGTDKSKYKMVAKCQIHISFNARVNDNTAAPGESAWNSFGYTYQTPLTQFGTEENSRGIELKAQPLGVGVEYPWAPVLKKTLTEEVTETEEVTDQETGETTTQEVTKVVPHPTEKDLACNFIIYEGEPLASLNDVSEMDKSEIAEILAAAGRKYVYVPLTVQTGKNSVEKGLWVIDYCSKFENGEFSDSDQRWKWVNAKKYTLLEVNVGEESIYSIEAITEGGRVHEGNNIAFTNSSETKLELLADNRYSNVDLILTKKMPTRVDTNITGNENANSTVVFKVEGKNKAGTVKYQNTVGLTFNSKTGASQTKILKNVPADLEMTVTEVYAGNYKPKDGKTAITKVKVEPYEGTLEEYQGKMVWQFEFENEPNDSNQGSGIVNEYENKNGLITYKDGSTPADSPK